MSDSILTGLEDCPLHTRTPFGYRGVSRSIFSIARHYGGIESGGEFYAYVPPSDELIRADVLKWKTKREKELKKQEKEKS